MAQAARASRLESTYEYIQNKLARGELEPGTKLSRRKLAEEIGVSPALVQQALNQLGKAGFVESRAQSGTYVRELTAVEFDNLCDLRELIEPYAAARAAQRITAGQLRILENSCRRYHRLELQISQAQSPQEIWKIHSQIIDEERVFHGTILSAAGNDLLTSLIESLRILARVRHNFARDSLARDANVVAEHQQIVAGLSAHDPDVARHSMLEHIQNGREVLKQRLLESPVSADG